MRSSQTATTGLKLRSDENVFRYALSALSEHCISAWYRLGKCRVVQSTLAVLLDTASVTISYIAWINHILRPSSIATLVNFEHPRHLHGETPDFEMAPIGFSDMPLDLGNQSSRLSTTVSVLSFLASLPCLQIQAR